MQILVVTCNTDSAMTAAIAACARRAARPGTDIRAAEPSWGRRAANGYYESHHCRRRPGHPRQCRGGLDAVVMAGYGEHGREGAQQVLDVPVVDITEASGQLAMLLCHRFGAVTTTSTSIAAVTDSPTLTGPMSRCSGIAANDGGADAIVLGCSGFAGVDTALEELLGVPVIDPAAAAVVMCKSLVRLRKRTSKNGPYARLPVDEQYVDVPISTRRARRQIPAEEVL